MKLPQKLEVITKSVVYILHWEMRNERQSNLGIIGNFNGGAIDLQPAYFAKDMQGAFIPVFLIKRRIYSCRTGSKP